MKRLIRWNLVGRFGAAALALAVWSAAAPRARADVLDKEMLGSCATVMEHLQKQGYKNVGVLKFRVQVGKGQPRFDVGRLNSLMATRLENALILANDEENPVGVTRGASQVAANRDKGATYLTAEGLQKLFAGTYPLAWGKEVVKIDAFLTGVVKLSPDMAKATIVLQEYTPSAAKPNDLATFTVPTNRLLLADLNRNFFVTKRSLENTVTFEEGDKEAVKSAVKPDPKGIEPEPKQGADETLDSVLEFDAYYDKEKVQPGADGRLPTPKKGQEVYFTLKAKERLGVILKVNGVNTLSKEGMEREPDEYSMWVLDPGVQYTIRGYYTPDKAFEPFQVLDDSESALASLADDSKRGKIELSVFRAAPVEALPDVGSRSVQLRSGGGIRAESYAEARGALRKVTSARRSRGLMVPGENQGAPVVRTTPFQGVLAGHRTISYFETSAKAP